MRICSTSWLHGRFELHDFAELLGFAVTFALEPPENTSKVLDFNLGNRNGIMCKRSPSVALCNIIKDGSKLGLKSDLLKSTVRNMTTDIKIKPTLLDLFSMTSRFQPITCPVISEMIDQGINENSNPALLFLRSAHRFKKVAALCFFNKQVF